MNPLFHLKQLTDFQRKNLFLILTSYFFILFTYPIIRSLATTYFLEDYGAKDIPLSWLFAIGLLAVTIAVMNRVLPRLGVQKVFAFVSFLTALLLFLLKMTSIQGLSFLFSLWKEVYIVVLIHSFLAYANSYFKLEDFKNWLGAIAAMGSLGGILGGFLLSGFVKQYGLDYAFVLAGIGLIFPAILFFFCEPIVLDHKKKIEEPLKAIKGVGSYVFTIGTVVALAQFVTTIANHRFNLLFEETLTGKLDRTEFLGKVYGMINTFSLIAQFFIMPFLMKRFKAYTIHFFLPLSYFLAGIAGVSVGGALGAAGTLIFYKGSDYSFFSMAKELLYHPLENIQKFGAKYITDMFVYRLAKALIALVLYQIEKPLWVDIIFILSLGLWFIFTFKLKSEFLSLKKDV